MSDNSGYVRYYIDQLAHNNTQQQVQRKNVNRKTVNSSTVLVFGYEYERVEDRSPMCRGVCRGCRNDSLVLTLVWPK